MRSVVQAAESKNISDLSALLAKWIENPESHELLAHALNAALDDSQAGRESWVNWFPSIATYVDQMMTDSVKAVKAQFARVTKDNAIQCLDFILSEQYKARGWSQWAPNFLKDYMPALVRTPLTSLVVAKVLDAFMRVAESIVGSDARNASRLPRKELLCAYGLYKEGRINPLRFPNQVDEIYKCINTATVRSEISHRRFECDSPMSSPR